MLKIDLLPAYVRERERVRKALMAVAMLIALEILGVGAYYTKQSKDLAAINKQIEDITDEYNKSNEFEEKTNAEKSKLPPIASLVSKYETCLDTHDESIKVYQKIAEYTSAKAKLDSVQLTNSTAIITGKITGLDALGQFLLNFMRCPAFSSVQFQANLQSFSYGGGGGPAAGAPGMGPGAPPGAAPAGAPAMAPAAPPGAGPVPGGPAQGAPAAVSAGAITLPTREVSFTLVCSLAKPLPSPGGAAAAAGAPGMPGAGPPGAAPAEPGPGAGPPGGGAPAAPPGGPPAGGKAGGKASVVSAPSTKSLKARQAEREALL